MSRKSVSAWSGVGTCVCCVCCCVEDLTRLPLWSCLFRRRLRGWDSPWRLLRMRPWGHSPSRGRPSTSHRQASQSHTSSKKEDTAWSEACLLRGCKNSMSSFRGNIRVQAEIRFKHPSICHCSLVFQFRPPSVLVLILLLLCTSES